MRIGETRKPTEEKIKLGLKVKDDIIKLTNLNIEKVYIFDEYIWGEDDDTPAFCLLADVRIRDIDESFQLVEEYSNENNIKILVWTMCQFEKRKSNPTELDYYIENYGVKIYDTEKIIDIDENVKSTEYAAKMDDYRYLYRYKKNNPSVLIKSLLEIYVLKINYPINIEQDLDGTIKYIRYISKDEVILDTLDKFGDENSDKFKLCKDLEVYIKNLKQIRPKMELEDRPTMQIYERLLDVKRKSGHLNISNLTKENLYILYVMQKKSIYEIAELFDVTEEQISKTRKNFGFKMIDSIWYEETETLVRKAYKEYGENAYFIMKKMGIFNFEKHTYDILNYVRDGERYILKEFWKFTKGQREGLELEKAKTSKDVYFRAYLCVELLKENNLVEEVDYLTYRITKKGKDVLDRFHHIDEDELNLVQIYKITGEANFYALSMIRSANEESIFCENLDELGKYINAIKFEEEEEKINLPEKEEHSLTEVNFEDILVKKSSRANKNESKIRRVKVDYNKINLSKEKVGEESEKKVYNLEKQKLMKENREDLAEKVFWESKENGDGAGYDIKSFEKIDGEYVEIYIEVKGTSKKIDEAFEISINEIEASNKYDKQYYIYRVAEIYSENPHFYRINGKIADNFNLEATSFKARKK